MLLYCEPTAARCAWILNSSTEEWKVWKATQGQNLFKWFLVFARLFLFDRSSNAEALLLPIAVTPKIALCLGEIAMATITSHMLMCVWASQHAEVHRMCHHIQLMPHRFSLLHRMRPRQSSSISGLILIIARRKHIVLKMTVWWPLALGFTNRVSYGR